VDLINKTYNLIGYLFRRAGFWFGFYIRPPIHWFIGLFSQVGNPPVFDRDVFSWAKELEVNWEAIRYEAMDVLNHRDKIPPLRKVSPDHDRIATDDKWKTFFIWGYNYKFEHNARRCPVTTREIERIPGLISAFYSIHSAGTHLPRHYGPTKGTITCHLALSIPQITDGCRISVDDKDYQWHEGHCFIFDDTYYHEVWNKTDEDRVILLIQFERPLYQPGKAVADCFMWLIHGSPFIQETLRRIKQWENQIDDGVGTDIKDMTGH